MTDDELLSNLHMDRSCIMQLNRLVENDEFFSSFTGNMGKQSSILHIMVLLRELWEWSIFAKAWLNDGYFLSAVNKFSHFLHHW